MSQRLYTVEAYCIRCAEPLGVVRNQFAADWIGAVLSAANHVKCPNRCAPYKGEPHLRHQLVWQEQHEGGRLTVISTNFDKPIPAELRKTKG